MTQKSFKIPNFDAVYIRIIHVLFSNLSTSPIKFTIDYFKDWPFVYPCDKSDIPLGMHRWAVKILYSMN